MEAAVTQAVATVLEASTAGWAEVAVLAAACLAVQALGAKEDAKVATSAAVMMAARATVAATATMEAAATMAAKGTAARSRRDAHYTCSP